MAELLADPRTPDYLRDPSYGRSLLAYGRAEAMVDLLAGWLNEQDLGAALTEVTRAAETEDREGGRDSGRVRRRSVSRRTLSVWEQLVKAEKLAAHLRHDLGLPPRGRAGIARDLGLAVRSAEEAVAALAERGRQIRERREAELRVIEGRAEAAEEVSGHSA